MKFLFEISKEHNTLPKSEVLSVLEGEGIKYNLLESNEDALLIDFNTSTNNLSRIIDRLAFTYIVDRFLFKSSSSTEEIKKNANDYKIKKQGSIAIRCKNRSKNVDSQMILKTLAEIYTINRKVSLQKPDIEVRALITDFGIYVGTKEFEINRSLFDKRKVQYRPFFSPISLHPKIARALVNISSIKKGEVLLDPFCGTGGILIEAGLIGAKVIGSDIEDKMINGCKETLEFYNIKNYDLFCADIGDIKNNIDVVDSVVTDFPYGKSTTTKGEKLESLYTRSFESISHVLKRRGKAVIGISNKDMASIGEQYFSLIEIHPYRMHRSLTRYFVVYRK